MGEISKQNIEVGVGGSGFSKPFIEEAQSATPKILSTLVDAGVTALTEYKKRQAVSESKSLLEEFTGFERKKEIFAAQDALDTQEDEIDSTFAQQQAHPGTAAFALGQEERSQITRARGELERKKDAVDQGLLSYEDYRREAETLFYQQVALTPGLKDEIAGAMGEFLGIDPRGQTAAIAIEKRKAEMKQGRDTLSTMRTSMQKLGLWDTWRTESQNFAMYEAAFKERARAMGDLDLDKKKLEHSTNLSDAEYAASARSINQNLVKAKPQALHSMGFFAGQNILNMSTPELMNLDEQTRLDWRAHLQTVRDRYVSTGNDFASLNPKFDAKPHQADIVARYDLLDKILSGTMKEEETAIQLKILADQNNITIEREKHGLLADFPMARRLGAMNDLIDLNVLSAQIAASTTVSNMLSGITEDVNALSPEQKAEKMKTFQWTLQQLSNGWENKQDWDKNHVIETGNMVASVSRHLSDELDNPSRVQLMRITSNKGFMDKLATESPRNHRIISETVGKHQAKLTEAIGTKLGQQLALSEAKAQPNNFYLKKEDDTWVMVPTTEATKIKPRKPLKASADIGSQALLAQQLRDRGLEDKNIEALDGVTKAMNTRGQLSFLIRSRANVAGVSEAEAARQLAVEMGLSTSDKTELPGFGDQFKKKPKKDKPQEDASAAVDPTLAQIQELAAAVPGATFQEIKDFIEQQATA